MSYSEDIIKLRKRVLDAVTTGVVDPNLKDFYEATLLQIMNESERQRQVAIAQAEQFRKQAAIADGQASAYSAMSSMVYNVLNAFIVQAERAQAHEASLASEQAEKEAYKQSLLQKENVAELSTEEVELEDAKKKVNKKLNQ
jgi:hypothetical protein